MFKGKNTLVVFGDSNVWGTELKDAPEKQGTFTSVLYSPETINDWPHHIRNSFSGILAERNNMKILNLAIPGTSNDTIFKRVNKLIQGSYPIKLDDCFVMIFWTAVERREFYNALDERYFNYSPAWPASLNSYKFYNKFHDIYSKNMFSYNQDILRSFNYVYSLDGLLSYKGIEFLQGYSLFNHDLSNMIKKYKLKNLLSNEEKDSVQTIPVLISSENGKNNAPNDYVGANHHPTELGHMEVANRYCYLLRNR